MAPNTDSCTQLYLPDLLRDWPWPRQLNSYYDLCKAESDAWCESFRAFSPTAQKAFNSCDFGTVDFYLGIIYWSLISSYSSPGFSSVPQTWSR